MRVLVASDGIAGLASAQASEVIGAEFAAHGAQVAVIPMAVSGHALHEALLRIHPDAEVVSCSDPDDVFRHLGASRTRPLYLDLSGMPELDVDEVLGSVTPQQLRSWQARARSLSTRAPSASTRALSLSKGDQARALSSSTRALSSSKGDQARALSSSTRALSSSKGPLVAMVGTADVSQPLTGMPGIIAERGRLGGLDLAETIAANDRASAWLTAAGLDPETTTGAASGLGAIIEAAGGQVADGVTACAEAGRFNHVASRADVVVTGSEQLDFHAVGGPVLKEAVSRAGQVLRPAIAVVGRCFVSPRELRIAGVETAYPVLDGPGEEPPSVEQLRRTAARVAATWRF